MAKVIVPIISVGLLALLAGGCGPSLTPYVGDWVGYRNVPTGDNPMLARALAKVEVVIKDDGSFELHDGGMRMNGRISSNSKGFLLDVATILDRPIQPGYSKPTVTLEGSSMAFQDAKETVQLARKKS